MRFTAKQLLNIAVVTVVGLVATTWAVFGLAHVRFDKPKVVRVQLASSGGALPGAEVTYLGVPVGRVGSARLVPGALELKLEIRPKGPMPHDLAAVVRQKTALGEPYVDLMPAHDGAKPGDPDGELVPVSRTRVPRTLDQLLQQADALLADVKPDDLHTLIEGGSGLAGHDDDVRALTASGARIGEVLSKRKNEIGRLLHSSAEFVEALDTHRDALSQSLSSGGRLTAVFARHTDDLVQIMNTGATLGAEADDLMIRTRANWTGTLAGLDASTHNLADRPARTHEILQLVPPYLQRLARTFSEGLAWSSNGGVPPFPYQPVYAIPLEGKGLHIDDLFIPSLAGKIRMDFGGSDPGGALLLLNQQEFQQASQSPEAYQQVIQQALARLKQVGHQPTPDRTNLDATR